MPEPQITRDIVFYDGTCGLCHGATKWMVERDQNGIFLYAPIGGATFEKLVPPEDRALLPDSVAVRAPDGKLLVRSEAALYILQRLGGSAGKMASALKVLPRPLRDLLYRGVAATRYRIFGRRKENCPLVLAEVRSRFLD